MNLSARLKKILIDDLVVHTAIVFLGTTLVGAVNFLYHIVCVRLLSPQDYGTFNALISFIMFTSMAISPLATTLTRFFSEYITKQNFGALVFVFSRLTKRLLVISLLIMAIFWLSSSFLATFLKVQKIHVVISGLIMSISLFQPLFSSLFVSLQKFKIYSFIGILTSLGKLITGIIFILLGWKVLGGLFGLAAASVVLIMFSLFFVLGIFNKEIDIKKVVPVPVDLSYIYKYFFPVGVTMLSFTALISADVILVKHFFSPIEAGYYSIAQMVGKIAFYLPSALAIVILPKSTRAYVTDGSDLKLLYKSLILAAICCFSITAVSFLFPKAILRALTGEVNLVSVELVGLFSLAMSFYAFTWIVVNYLLGMHNTKIALPILLLAVLEGVVIYNCHPTLKVVIYNLLGFSVISFFASFIIAKSTKSNG